jgi:hypothetical protein
LYSWQTRWYWRTRRGNGGYDYYSIGDRSDKRCLSTLPRGPKSFKVLLLGIVNQKNLLDNAPPLSSSKFGLFSEIYTKSPNFGVQEAACGHALRQCVQAEFFAYLPRSVMRFVYPKGYANAFAPILRAGSSCIPGHRFFAYPKLHTPSRQLFSPKK